MRNVGWETCLNEDCVRYSKVEVDLDRPLADQKLTVSFGLSSSGVYIPLTTICHLCRHFYLMDLYERKTPKEE